MLDERKSHHERAGSKHAQGIGNVEGGLGQHKTLPRWAFWDTETPPRGTNWDTETSPGGRTGTLKRPPGNVSRWESNWGVTPDSKPAKRKSRGRSKKIEEDNKFPCTECDYKTVSKAKLSDHIQRMHKGSASSCDVCGKVFPNQTYMQRHRTSHVAPQHCCDVCGKMFKIEKAMRNHRKTHEDGYTRPVFHCDMCPKTFCSQYLVDCHVKSTHMGQKKSYLCSSCGKKFTTKHSLQEHSNAHSGIKPHVCEICGKGFSYDSALRDHKFTHEEVKQFQCTLCFKSFCQRSGLKMHMRIHKDTKQFQCEDCGREFTQKQALQRHERVHKGVKPFICRLCSRSFTDASIIRRHLILVHKIHKDAKTWREDIICNVKPDLDYHVGLAGEKASPSQEQNVVHSKTKHSANRRDSLKAGNETDKLNKKKPVAVGTVPPLLSEILFSQTSTSSTVSSGYDRDRSVDSNAQLVHASALRQTSGHVTSHPPDHHSSELLPQTHVPEPVKLKSVTATPSNSQPFSVLPHFMSGSSESIPPGCRDVNSRCTLEDQRPSIPHLAQGVIETPGHAPLQSDTPSNPVFLDGSQICKRDVPINYHRSPTADTHHCFDGHVQGSGEQETSAIITTAESTSSGTGKAAASTSVATPQPWSSFYYYSQLASQFGVNFAEYPYIASGALPGGGLGVGGGVGPSSHGMEHPPTVHPRPQPLSYSHGHSGTESLPHTQELHPNPSAMYHETHTGSSGHIVSPSPPCVAMSRGGHQGTHASVTARDSSSSPPVQKEIGGGVSHSPP
ncbi:hypothetical protein BaRGS_00008173 [Batillaria attramentaria]|uniref:C2H2-type domain-containing protein n=1 Tax=Batillaria attramentaria TaxID=370345 RepID=A0ABD0LNM7_9CAEN